MDALVPLDAFRLDGRVAIVTGASSGLGQRFARVLAGAGAVPVLVARREDRLAALQRELGIGMVIRADLSDAARAEDVVSAAHQHFGRIDIVVNNAGVTNITPAESEALVDFERVLKLNLMSTFALAQSAARKMLDASGGSIVNIASILGVVGVGQMPQAAYAASKGGVVNLTRELGAQWARRGVRVMRLRRGGSPQR